jgi:hypothetical protein
MNRVLVIFVAALTLAVSCHAPDIAKADVKLAASGPTIAVGYRHTCAVDVGGKVFCWGDNSYHQLEIPNGLDGVTQIAASTFHTCAVTKEKNVVCWGDNTNHQVEVPSTLTNVKQIAIGRLSCAITFDGIISCWGTAEANLEELRLQMMRINQETELLQITDDGWNTCVRVSQGVWCYLNPGQEWQWQFFKISSPETLEMFAGFGLTILTRGKVLAKYFLHQGFHALTYAIIRGVVSIQGAAGKLYISYNYGCNLNSSGSMICFGEQNTGVTTPLNTLGKTSQLALGMYHACGVNDKNMAVCWGSNSLGQIDVPSTLGQVLGYGQDGPKKAPKISGTPKATKTLTVISGVWNEGVNLSFQWLRNGKNIRNQTKSTYKVLASDRGQKICARITATRLGFNALTMETAFVKIG